MNDYANYIKSQVSQADWKIIEKLDLNLNLQELAELWTDFVNFEKRRKSEIPFLKSLISEYKKPIIFDACLGSGATSLGLLLEGFNNITSNEIDSNLISIAKKYANHYGKEFNITMFDWRELNNHFDQKYDFVFCLGNSLTYLFNRKDQLTVLNNFKSILQPNGTLVIDERNYHYHFLGGKYQYSGEFLYCGNGLVNAHPIHVSNSMIVMEYFHKTIKKKAHLVLYPFGKNELKELLNEIGFTNIISYGDYKSEFNPEKPEFITHVARE